MSNKQLIIDLNISADQYLLYYQGAVKQVQAVALTGQTVRFPATILRPFVGHHGIHGRFQLLYNDAGKLLSINKI